LGPLLHRELGLLLRLVEVALVEPRQPELVVALRLQQLLLLADRPALRQLLRDLLPLLAFGLDDHLALLLGRVAVDDGLRRRRRGTTCQKGDPDGVLHLLTGRSGTGVSVEKSD